MRRTFILSAKPFNCFFSIKNKLLSVKSSFKMEEGRFAKRIELVEVSKPIGVIPIRFGLLLEIGELFD
jgi:hypothetical protein